MLASDTFFFSDGNLCITGLPSRRCTFAGQCYYFYILVCRKPLWLVCKSSARVRDYYKEWGMKQLNFMLKFACLWSVFATCNAMFSVCKIWFIIPDAFSSGCCYQTGSLPHCNDVWAREEATDGIEFCYKHQISFYESNLLRFRCCWRSEDLRDRCQWC